MQKYLAIILIFLTLLSEIYCQKMWSDYGLDGYSFTFANELSIDSLENIIRNHTRMIKNGVNEYKAAVKYLYYKHKDTETQFLLQNLNTEIDTTLPVFKKMINWQNYYIDAYILGLLGDPTAVDKMDTVAGSNTAPDKNYAIRNLAEIGRFDYYDYIKEKYLNDEIDVHFFAMYGADNRYTSEVRVILEQKLNSIDPNDWMNVTSMLDNFWYFDPGYKTEKLNEYFLNTSGETKYWYFFELGKFDIEGQVERSKYCLLNEVNDDLRVEYLPRLYRIDDGWDSKKYLEPDFIKFLSELPNLGPGSSTYHYVNRFLSEFKPLPPDSLTNISNIIDKLNGIIDTVYNYSWLNDETLKDELISKLQSAQNDLSSSDSMDCAIKIKAFQDSVQVVYSDSAGSYPRYINSLGYRYLYWYSEYILERLPEPPVTGLNIKLIDSQNNYLPGGSLQYYESGWKDAFDNGNGTFKVTTEQTKLSLRMTYEYGSQTISNVPVTSDTAVFQTVDATVELRNSGNNFIEDSAMVKYYASGWREFGYTANGVAHKELLPGNYSFRMTYAYASNDKKQDLNDNPVVTFSTVNATVELRDSENDLINEDASVKYYASGWRDFGSTTNGSVQKELLPNNYSFRMIYAYASNDKKQDLNENTTVTFNTVNTTVELRNSENNLINEDANVKYYASGWRDFGATTTGFTQKELLPNNYSFRMTYAYASNDKKQDLNENTTVTFNTVKTTVELRNSENNFISEDATVKYYASGWRDFGATINGVVQKELLPNNYSFRLTYEYASNDKKQDLNNNSIVTFNTVNTTVELRNSENNLITEDASVKYYASGWRDFGTTASGTVQKELLPNNYSFRMTHEFLSNDKKQDIGVNNIVTYNTVLCTVSVNDSDNLPVNEALVKYYASGWRDIGLTENGTITKQMLPNNISFRVTKDGASQDKKQDLNTNPTVQFILGVEE